MFRFYRTGFGKVFLGLVVVGLGAGGALAGTGIAASGASSPLDHFWCYSAAGSGFKPVSVKLINEYTPSGFVPTIGAVSLHCNPVTKTATVNGKTTTTKPFRPNSHLLCWGITAKKQPNRAAAVANQFGVAKMKLGQPTELCLPTWKSLTGPPANPTVAPSDLSHFTCYTILKGSTHWRNPPPVSVRLKDQFSNPKTLAVKLGDPTILCQPTTKVTATKSYKALNPKYHLMCFDVKPTPPVKKGVFDKNQFGSGKVAIKKTSQLCLPSTR